MDLLKQTRARLAKGMAKKNATLKKEFHGRRYKDGNALDRADYCNLYRTEADGLTEANETSPGEENANGEETGADETRGDQSFGYVVDVEGDVHVPIDHVEVRKPRATQRRKRQR